MLTNVQKEHEYLLDQVERVVSSTETSLTYSSLLLRRVNPLDVSTEELSKIFSINNCKAMPQDSGNSKLEEPGRRKLPEKKKTRAPKN
jgi:hypothetical protein